jgi:hypothetical protein
MAAIPVPVASMQGLASGGHGGQKGGGDLEQWASEPTTRLTPAQAAMAEHLQVCAWILILASLVVLSAGRVSLLFVPPVDVCICITAAAMCIY